MHSFTNYIFNKAQIFRLQRYLQLAFVLFLLISFQKGKAQCPVASPIAATTICSGTIISVALTSDLPGATYTWTAVQTDVVGSGDCSSGCGSTIGDTLTAVEVFPGSVVYTVTPFTALCPAGGLPILVNITVNPIPLAIASNSTICSGATSSVAITSDVAGTTFAWTVIQAGVSGASPGAGSLISQTLNTTGPSSGIATYNIIPTADGCVGEPINTKVTIRQLPAINLGANPEVCVGTLTANLTYSATGGGANQYSVNFDAIAEAQGFVDVVNQVLPASPIVLVVPGGAAIGVYNAVLSVNNTINGCPGASYPITVTVTAPIPQVITGTTPICVGGTAVWTSTSPGGTWSSATPGVATVGAASGLVTGISAGTSDITYSVTIGGCVNTAIKTVTITASTPQIITGLTSLCVGGTDTWTSTTAGGTWSSATPGVATVGAGTGLVTGISAGTSDITYSVTTGGCVNTAMQTVTISDPTPQVITGTSPLCVGATAIWTSTSPGGTWSSATPGVATVAAVSGLVTAVSVGTSDITYSVTIGGCVNTAIKTVTVNASPILVINDPVALCSPATADLTDAAVTAGSTIGLTFTYFTDAGAISVFPTPAVAPAGTYYIVGTAVGGCADTAAVTVTVNTKPDLITVPQTVCSPATSADLTDPSVTAGSTPGLIFTYFTDAGATSVYGTPSAATAGTYYIVGTLGGLCSDTTGVNVTVNPSPNVVTNNQTVCSPSTVDLTAGAITLGSTGGLTFTYFTDAGAIFVYATPTVAPAGTYYIVGLTPEGCRDTSAVTVTVNTTPTVITVPQAACSPAKVNLTLAGVTAGSTPGLSFTYWMDALATIPHITPTLATTGTYYIVGTIGGCSDTTAVTVTINPKPDLVTNNPATVCAPATVDLTLNAVTLGSTLGLTFTYFTDAAATISYPTPTTATSGTYYIVGTVNPGSGCTDTAAVIVTITPKPTVVTVPQTACDPSAVNLTLGGVTAGSTGGLSFTYFTDAAATTSVVGPTAVGTGTYYIVGSTIGGCSDTTAVTVTINPTPDVIITPPAAVCSPATVDLTLPAVTVGSTGLGVLTYFLDAGLTMPNLSPSAVSASGTYYIVGTLGSCSDIEPVTVTINPQPTVIAAPLSLCLAASVDLTDPSVTAGSGPLPLVFTYFTDPGATIPVPVPTAVGAGTYYIVGTIAATGCSNITSVDVTLAPVVLTTDQAACLPTTTTDLTSAAVTAGSTPGLIFTYYSDLAITILVPDETTVTAGTYYIVGTTPDGCADTTAVTFTVNPKPNVTTVAQSICAPSTVDLTAGPVTFGSDGGLTFSYFTNAAATIVYGTPTTAGNGTYYIVGSTMAGCTDTASVAVTINPQPTVVALNQATCFPITTIDLTLAAVTAGSDPLLTYTYFTDPGATLVYGTPTVATAGTYYIKGTLPGIGGCSNVDGLVYTVNPKPDVVTVPQSICSPGTIDLTLPAVTAGSTVGLAFSYFNDALATSPYLTPTTAGNGTYYIKGATLAGCADTTAVVVTIDPKPIVVTVPQNVCTPATTADLTLPAVTSGGGLTYTYFTDPGATSPYGTPTVATTGTYYIVGVTPDGCSDTASVVVTVSPKPTVITVPQPICTPLLTVDITQPAATFGSTPLLTLTYFTDAAATITFGTPTIAGAGTYYIVGQSTAGCYDTTGITVTVNPKPTVITNDPPPICSPATSDLTLAAVTFGSTGGLTFSYFTDALATSVYPTPATAVAATYYIVGVTLAGCSDTTAVNVISDAIPTVVTVPQTICSPAVSTDLTLPAVTFGSTVGLTFTYFTDILATLPVPDETAAGVGTYYIVGSTPGGCTDTTPVVVTLDPGANAGTVTGISPLCIGATDTYTSDGDLGGSWSSTNPLVATVVAGTGLVTAVIAGTTDITYTVIGCSGPISSFLTLTVSPDVNAGIVSGTTPLCIGATDTYTSNGDPAGSWTSTNPLIATVDAFGLVTAVAAGTSDITYTSIGCNGTVSSFLTLTVSPNANPGIVSGTTPLCIGATDIYSTNGDIGGSWTSSDPSVATVDLFASVTAVSAGTADITYTLSSGCNPTSSFLTLTVSPNVNAGTVSGTTPLCTGASDTYTSDGDIGGVWTSSDPSVATVGAGTGLVTTIVAGTTDITYTVNGCGGPVSSFLTLTVDPTNSGTVSGTTPLCIGATDPFSSDGAPGGTWASTNPAVASVIAGTGVVTALTAGTTDITYTLIGCSTSSLLTLTVSPNVSAGIISGTTPLCIGASDTYTSDGDAGGSWTSTNPLVATVIAGTGAVTAVSAGSTDITYTVNGCNGPASAFLTLTVSPNVNAGVVSGTSPLCIGATDTYTSNGDAGGSWSSTNPLVATVVAGTGLVTAVSAGTSDITYTVNGCNGPAAAFLTLTVDPDANPGTISGTTPLCIGATDTYTTDGSLGGTWSSTNPLIATVIAGTGLVTAVSAGATDITYTLSIGCNSPISSILTLTVSPDASAGTVSGTTPLCMGTNDTYTSNGDAGGSWSSSDLSIATVDAITGLVTAVSPGTANIIYTVNGCNGPATALLALTVDPTNSGTVSGTTPLCIGASAPFTSDGDPGGSWASTNPLVASVIAGTGVVTALSAGTTDITYTLLGCSSASFLTLTVDPDVNAGNISGVSPLCIGTADTYTSDGDLGGTWSSTNLLVASVDAVTGLVTALTAGTSDITYTVTGCNGPDFITVTLTVDPINSGTVSGTTPLCIGATDPFASDGTPGGTWASTNPLIASVVAGTGVVTALSAGTTDITYTLVGCGASSFLTLTVDPDATAGNLSLASPLCIGSSDTYTSDGDAGGTWTSTNPLVATVIAGTGVVSAVSAGTTDITYTVNGCNGPASMFVTLTVLPDADAGIVSGTTPLCIGATANFTSNGDLLGSWSSGDVSIATVNLFGVVTAVSAGTTNITYSALGCNGPATAFLAVTVDPNASSGTVSGTSPLCIGVTDTYTSDGDIGGSWSSTDPLVATVDAFGLVTAVSGGTTDITYTVSSGCNNPFSSILTLTVDPDANAGIVSGTTPLCIGATANFTSNGDLLGSWSSSDPAVATVAAATGVVTAVSAGTTDITYTVNGCNGPADASLTLTVNPDVIAGVVSGTSPLCIGISDTYTSTGDAGGAWTSTDPLVATVVSLTGVVTAVSAGTTNITYTVSGCNGPLSAFQTLTVDPNATAGVISGTTPLCIGATATYTSDGDAGGSWSSTNPLIATVVAGTGLVTAVSAGTTDITYTVSAGCNNPVSSIRTLTVSPNVDAGIVSGISPLCVGATATYTSDGDAGGSWSSTDPLIATVVAGTGVVTAVSAGTSDITYTVNGCNGPASAFQSLTVNSTPVLTVTGINLNCFNICNGNAIANVAGGNPLYRYAWSSGISDTIAATVDTLKALCIGGYTVTVTDANGCSDTDSVTLTQPTQVVPNVTTGNISCLGVCDGLSESSPTGGTAPYTFAWNTGSVDTLITDLCPGTYTVIVTDALGCTISLPDTIVQAATVLSNAIITNATCGLCDGQVVLSPSGGISPYTFLWGSGQTSDTETNLCAGLYSVNITDSAGCSSSYSIPISNPGGPTSATITSTNISCFGLSDGTVTGVTPVGGTPPYSYLWIQGGQTTPTLSNLGAGVYYVQIADSIGCSLIDSVTITEPTQVVVNQFITASTCGACDGSLSVAPSGGAAPYTVVWSTGSVLDTITSLCPGFYSVQITDFVGCSQSVVMPLNSLNAPTLASSSVPLLCNAACNATATVVAAGGILPYTYLWNDPGAQTTDVATALCAGTYFVQVTGGGCVSFASVEITDPAPIGFSLANSVDPLCNGNNNGSISAIPFGGTLPYSFSWTGSGSVSDTASGLSSGVYTVTVTDANGCTSSQSNTLANPDSLTISNVPTPASCNTIADGAIDVTVGGGTPGYTYQWSGGSALTTQDLTGILIGSYDITVTDTNGCSITDNIIITSTVTVNAVAGNDTAFCEPGTILLSASGSSANVTNYQWFQIPSNTLVGSVVNVSVTPTVGVTDYYVIVDNGAGCAHNDTVTVTVNGLPVANAGADVTILATSTTVLGGNPTGPVGATYSWDPILGLDNGTNSNPVANPTVTTTYTVTVTSAEGCISSDIVIVTVVANITFANGISPNADGANDEWIIDNIELFPRSVVEVYNRWGELLFQSTGYTEKWKGVFKGQLLPVGTYYYIINLNDPFFPDVLTGPITILR